MKHNEPVTCLYGSKTVEKNHPQIALRGELDSLLARAVYACAYARQQKLEQETAGLTDVIHAVKELIRCEASQAEPEIEHLLGLSLDELREASYHPDQFLHAPHYFPDENSDMMTAILNLLRTDIRKAERVCVCAGLDQYTNRGIQKILNRLSSAVYIIMLRHNAK